MKKALVFGVTGQDGSYLSELLLSKGYEVYGFVRRSSSGYGALRNLTKLINDPEIYRKRFFLRSGDMADTTSIYRVINEVRPDEIYNLAAQADVGEAPFMPDYSVDINGNGAIRILEAIRMIDPKIRMYQASTSELFGDAPAPQNEKTPMNPLSPYSWGKYVAYQAVKIYRESYGLYAVNGILFNHESERRGDDYLTRKVTKAVARIKTGLQDNVRLGDLKPQRDWGYSKDYVEMEWLMLQQETPDDYVIGTGETHTVQEWVEEVFALAGFDWTKYVIQDPKLFRPAEVPLLLADMTKAEEKLGWKATVKFKELAKIMYENDLKLAEQEKRLYE